MSSSSPTPAALLHSPLLDGIRKLYYASANGTVSLKTEDTFEADLERALREKAEGTKVVVVWAHQDKEGKTRGVLAVVRWGKMAKIKLLTSICQFARLKT